jgi:phospholipid-binding lipoprotein MlaA
MDGLTKALTLAVALALAGCAATPGEDLGTVPPRNPVNADEQARNHPLDIDDPWERFNRGAYWFNTDLDRKILLPVVRGYELAMPDVAQQGVSNFFNNLRELQNGVNGALQGRGNVVGTAFGRFFINSTIGVFGLFDLATEFGYAERREDFGQTLGRWGVAPGPYLVLPLFGPSSLRDAGGLAFDFAVTSQTPGPRQVNEAVYFDPSVYGVYAVDQRHQIQFRYYQSGSPFEYDLVRFLYMKKRELDILR